MTDAPIVRLDSIADVRLGRQRSPKDHQGPMMRPYVRAANVGWSGLTLDDVKTMNFTDAEMAVYGLKSGDLLLNEASGSPSEVGKPAIWNKEIDECAFQNTLLRVRPTDVVDGRYLLHYFRQQASSGVFARKSRGVGIHHLGREALAGWPVPLPTLEEQRRISAVLDKAEKLRKEREASLELTTSLRESIFNCVFNAAHLSEVRLGEISDVQSGLQVTRAREKNPVEVPYLRVANVYRGRLDLDEVKAMRTTVGELERTKLRAGDLLVVEGHGNAAEIGRVARWTGVIEPCVHQNHLIRVRLDSGSADPTYVEALLNSRRGRQSLLRAARTTSGLNTISVKDVKAVSLLLPPVSFQRKFAHHMVQIDRLASSQLRHLDAVDDLCLALQQKAFAGEL